VQWREADLAQIVRQLSGESVDRSSSVASTVRWMATCHLRDAAAGHRRRRPRPLASTMTRLTSYDWYDTLIPPTWRACDDVTRGPLPAMTAAINQAIGFLVRVNGRPRESEISKTFESLMSRDAKLRRPLRRRPIDRVVCIARVATSSSCRIAWGGVPSRRVASRRVRCGPL
jgi:hypothetical protein